MSEGLIPTEQLDAARDEALTLAKEHGLVDPVIFAEVFDRELLYELIVERDGPARFWVSVSL